MWVQGRCGLAYFSVTQWFSLALPPAHPPLPVNRPEQLLEQLKSVFPQSAVNRPQLKVERLSCLGCFAHTFSMMCSRFCYQGFQDVRYKSPEILFIPVSALTLSLGDRVATKAELPAQNCDSLQNINMTSMFDLFLSFCRNKSTDVCLCHHCYVTHDWEVSGKVIKQFFSPCFLEVFCCPVFKVYNQALRSTTSHQSPGWLFTLCQSFNFLPLF